MKYLKIKIILPFLAVIFIIMQFFTIDKTNPIADQSLDFVEMTNPPQNISLLLKSTCYDCHSYHTKYPWYTNIAPFSWIIADHIKEGRKELNFSEWGNYTAKRADHKLEECYEEVEEGEMPLKGYTLIHTESRLSESERAELIGWFKEYRKTANLLNSNP